jgi:tRNA threonylcarbamoyladenosine biosynthesis protein TsaE
MDTLTKIIPTPEDMVLEAQAFIEALPVETEGATLVTLSGELGAGKTFFTQSVAQALGVGDVVNSPTFVIEKVYSIPEGSKFERLIHIDAYRLTNNSELTALGFGEIVSHPGNLIMLEWPENVVGVADHASVKILLEPLEDGSRQITYA